MADDHDKNAESAQAAQDDQAEAQGAPAEAPSGPTKRWYVVHTYSGHENRAKLSLLERIKNAKLQDHFGDILIPTENVLEVVKGQRRTSTRKFYPGYMFLSLIHI